MGVGSTPGHRRLSAHSESKSAVVHALGGPLPGNSGIIRL